jgi:cyanophycin synthetase
LRTLGVPESAIDIIPDEQAAIDAALRLGQPGDLLLVFADALTRSWKQIIKFKPDGHALAAAAATAAVQATLRASGNGGNGGNGKRSPDESSSPSGREEGSLEAQGFIRDERGLRFVGEAAD